MVGELLHINALICWPSWAPARRERRIAGAAKADAPAAPADPMSVRRVMRLSLSVDICLLLSLPRQARRRQVPINSDSISNAHGGAAVGSRSAQPFRPVV